MNNMEIFKLKSWRIRQNIDEKILGLLKIFYRCFVILLNNFHNINLNGFYFFF